MTKHELEFRKWLMKTMAPFWLGTVHVENDLNPGVPDVSYVMRTPDCETGWLELKAVPRAISHQRTKFTLEPSQHRWFETHGSYVPGNILAAWGSRCYLFPGLVHHRLNRECTDAEFQQMAIAHFDREDIDAALPWELVRLTNRGRNAAT